MISILISAQPVVTTTANVIYTIPTNDPSRFSTANVSASTSVHHHYGKLIKLSFFSKVLHNVQIRSTSELRSSYSNSSSNTDNSCSSCSNDNSYRISFSLPTTLVFSDTSCAKTWLTSPNKQTIFKDTRTFYFLKKSQKFLSYHKFKATTIKLLYIDVRRFVLVTAMTFVLVDW